MTLEIIPTTKTGIVMTGAETDMTEAETNMTGAEIVMAEAGIVMAEAEIVTTRVETGTIEIEINIGVKISITGAEINMTKAVTETLEDMKTEEGKEDMKAITLLQETTGIQKAKTEEHLRKEDQAGMKETEKIVVEEHLQQGERSRIFIQGRERAGPPTADGKYLQADKRTA